MREIIVVGNLKFVISADVIAALPIMPAAIPLQMFLTIWNPIAKI